MVSHSGVSPADFDPIIVSVCPLIGAIRLLYDTLLGRRLFVLGEAYLSSRSCVTLAEFDPFLDRSVPIPGVVACEHLNAGHTWLVEDRVLPVEESNGVSSGLILINASLVIMEERLLLLNLMMLFNHISMSCGQALFKFELNQLFFEFKI